MIREQEDLIGNEKIRNAKRNNNASSVSVSLANIHVKSFDFHEPTTVLPSINLPWISFKACIYSIFHHDREYFLSITCSRTDAKREKKNLHALEPNMQDIGWSEG